MLEDENLKNDIETKRREFQKLANELRDVRFEDEDILKPGEREILDPKECAVIVVDMQGSYCDPLEVLPQLMGSTTNRLSKVVPSLERFLEVARQLGVTVVWTKMKENPDDMPDNYKIKWKIDDTPPLSVPGTKGYDYTGVMPKSGDIEVEKNTYSSFESTDLDKIGAEPSECIFVDDTLKNVEAAQGLGIKSFLYTDLDKLKEDFRMID